MWRPSPLVRRVGFPSGKLRSAGTTGLMPCFLIGTQSCHQGAPSCHQDWPPCANQARVYNRWCITITTTTTTITIIPLTPGGKLRSAGTTGLMPCFFDWYGGRKAIHV